MPTPRTRKNRLPRKRIRATSTVGDEKMSETCPRCGWPCVAPLVKPEAWPSEWDGICTECCWEACDHFDKVGWPPAPWDVAASQGSEEVAEQPHLIDPGEALLTKKELKEAAKAKSSAGAPRVRAPVGVQAYDKQRAKRSK